MSSSDGFSNSKKILLSAIMGATALAGAGFLAYKINESTKKNQSSYRHSSSSSSSSSKNHNSSEITPSDLSLRRSKDNGLSQSAESLSSKITLTSFCSTACGFETASEMLTKEEVDEDIFFDVTSDDEELAEEMNRKNRIKEIQLKATFFDKVDKLFKGGDTERFEAYKLLMEKEVEFTENPEFLCRLAKAHKIQAAYHELKGNPEMKKKFVFDGLEYASKALALDPDSPDTNKWFAIFNGMMGDYVSIQEKVQRANAFEKHLHIALKAKKDDYSLYHLLGRYYYEIARISWWEWQIASALTGILRYDYRDAIPNFQKAEELNPCPWKENRLFLAKCHLETYEYEEAFKWLHLALDIPCRTEEDRANDIEIKNLIKTNEKYRK